LEKVSLENNLRSMRDGGEFPRKGGCFFGAALSSADVSYGGGGEGGAHDVERSYSSGEKKKRRPVGACGANPIILGRKGLPSSLRGGEKKKKKKKNLLTAQKDVAGQEWIIVRGGHYFRGLMKGKGELK